MIIKRTLLLNQIKSSLLDVLSSIDPEATIFSPVEPDIPSNVDFSRNKTVVKSLNSISSVDIIIRPALTEMTQTHNFNEPFSKLDGIPFFFFSFFKFFSKQLYNILQQYRP